MKEAKIFQNGQSQAIRLPKEFRFDGDSVFINRVGSCVMLVQKDNPWKNLIDACGGVTDDFLKERTQPKVEEREIFK